MVEPLNGGAAPTDQDIADLVNALTSAELALEQALGAQTDAVVHPGSGKPILLRATQEALQTSERQFRAVFEGARDAMVIADDRGNFVDVNPAACQLFGVPHTYLLGRQITDFAIAGYQDDPLWKAFLEYSASEGVFSLRRRNGELRHVEYSSTHNFLPGRHLSVLRDVTIERLLEARSRVLAVLAFRLSAVSSIQEAAEIVAFTADELAQWDSLSLDLYDPQKDLLESVLMIDIVDGARTVVPPTYRDKPSVRARRAIEEGAHLILRKSPARFAATDVPFGDTNRASLSLMYAPIRHQNQVLGLVTLQSYTPEAYNDADLEALQALADHCGGALYRLQKEQALSETQARYQQLFEAANDAIFVQSHEGYILDVNARACDLYGYTRSELVGQHISILVGDMRMQNPYMQGNPHVTSHGKPFEALDRKKDGSLFPVEVSLTPFPIGIADKQSGRELELYLAIVRDISERKHAEQVLENERQLLSTVLETLPVGVWIADANGNLVRGNAEGKRIWAGARFVGPENYGEYVGYWHATGERIRGDEWALARAVTRGETLLNEEVDIEGFDGTRKTILNSAAPLTDAEGRIAGAIVVNQDITARVRSEAQLAALANAALEINLTGTTSELLDLITSKAREIIGAHQAVTSLARDNSFTQFTVSASLSEKYAHYREFGGAPIGQAIYSLMVSHDRPLRLTQDELVRHPAFRDFNDDAGGSPPLVGLLVVPLVGRKGQILGLIQLSDRYQGDFTSSDEALLIQLAQLASSALENVRLYADVQKAERRFRQMAENVDQIFWLRDIQTGKMLYASPAFERLWGRPRTQSDVVGDYFIHAVLPEDIGIAQAAMDTLNVGEPVEATMRILRPDGAMRWVRVHGSPVRDEKGKVYRMVGTVEDVTERQLAQQQVARRAHEFQMLYETTRDLAGEHTLSAALDTIIKRASDLLDTANTRVWLYDKEPDDLALVAGSALDFTLGMRLPLGKGISGTAALNRKPLLISDYPNWEPRIRETTPPEELPRTAMGVPMIYGGELIGVLTADDRRSEHGFTESDVRLLELFAVHAASAVHTARLLEETRERAQQFELLYKAGLALNHELDAGTQLRLLLETTMTTLNAQRAGFFYYDEASQEFYGGLFLGSNPDLEAVFLAARYKAGEARGVIGLFAEERHVLNIPDLDADERWIPVEPEMHSGMWFPVRFQDQLRGVLGVLSPNRNAFNVQDEKVLELYANQFAVAMENARLFDETRQRVQQLQALHLVDTAIGTSFDLRLILEIHLDVTQRELGADAADILLFDTPLQTLTYIAGRGFRTPVRSTQAFWLGDLTAGRAVMERRTIEFSDLSQVANAQFAFAISPNEFVSYVGVPLISKGSVKGVLELYSRKPHLSATDQIDFLDTLAGQAALAIDNVTLYNDLQRKNHELALAYDSTIEGWSRALDLRDKETEGHTLRVTEMTLRLAPRLGVPESELINIKWGALLHDIGKMGIPDAILLKQGPLTEQEWEVMRRHPQYARDLLSPITYLRGALDIPHAHHEKWDGTGYPRGLKGEAIPLPARVFAVVDVWDALTSDRPYRAAWSHERALAHIREGTHTHFDPRVVDAFMELMGYHDQT